MFQVNLLCLIIHVFVTVTVSLTKFTESRLVLQVSRFDKGFLNLIKMLNHFLIQLSLYASKMIARNLAGSSPADKNREKANNKSVNSLPCIGRRQIFYITPQI